MKEIKPEELTENPLKLIGHDWLLITAQKGNKVNTMTASWGGVGYLWNQNSAFIFVRQSRFTKEFIDSSSSFSLCFFNHTQYQKELAYLGTVSGRDEDKIKKSGLTVVHEDKVPYFKEARLVLICSKAAQIPIRENNLINKDIARKWYEDEDYHDMYVGKIQKVLLKE
jgi:flavin reductase (DIM6/NTAB) family NADH-FMN oxidoreductase RutF